MSRLLLTLALLLAAPTVLLADPLSVDRTIRKEPAYQTKYPRYALLVFEPEGKDRVWLVRDGATLYVDRNGNGDLTEAGEKIGVDRPKAGQTPEEGSLTFSIGELTVGGRTHKGLVIQIDPLARFASPSITDRSDVKAALAKDPKTQVWMLRAEVEVPGMKGGGGWRPALLRGWSL